MFASDDQTEQIHGSVVEFLFNWNPEWSHIKQMYKVLRIEIDWSSYKELWFVVDSGGRGGQKWYAAGQY